MIAILADPALFAEEFLRCRSELAAVNFSSHFVVTAKEPELARIETELKSRNTSYQRLPVSFAFHSRWIDEARTPFVSFMRSIRRKQNRLPMVCCDQTTIVAELSDGYLWDVVRQPIRFRRRDPAAYRRQPVVAPPLVVLIRRRPASRLGDPAIPQHPVQRAVKRARLELHLAVGQAGDFLQQAVAVAFLRGQRQENMEFDGS